MKVITASPTYLPFLCQRLEYTPSALAVCIVATEMDGTPVAGVIYDGYNGASIQCHIWVGGKPHREWWAAIFDYPFHQLKVKKIIGQVREKNLEARKLDEHFGFHLEAKVADYYEDGALLVYTMTPEQCRVLTRPEWASVVKRIRGEA